MKRNCNILEKKFQNIIKKHYPSKQQLTNTYQSEFKTLGQQSTANKKSLVTDLSNTLNSEELNVLSLGPNFAIKK